MGGWGWWLVAVSLAGRSELSCEPDGERGTNRPKFRVRIAHEATADTVRRALEAAAERLESDRCRSVFLDFRDLAGHPLQEALERTGHSPASYLSEILFYDGSRHRLCQKGRVLAVANPGSRVVQVCPEAIRERYRREPRYVEAILIHEALHTLGLGENPPTSFEITTRVLGRCTR
jgi:hypothetical protein